MSTGLVDLGGTGVTAKEVQRTVLKRFVTMRPGVGATPVSEFDNTGELLAKAFPVLFPYGVGAPGMLASHPKGQRIRLHEHGTLLMQHLDGRFQSHKLFPFALVNMIQRFAACRAAKAIVNHRDVAALDVALR